MQRKILIIDDHDDLATALSGEFREHGYHVDIAVTRDEAVEVYEEDKYDLVITDLCGSSLASSGNGRETEATIPCLPDSMSSAGPEVKAFKICLAHYRPEAFKEEDVEFLVGSTLGFKAKFIDRGPALKNRHEKIEFEVPSQISLMGGILDYLMRRVAKLGVVNPEKSNLFVALDEAFVNAVKHGNKFDRAKMVRISVDISPNKASFTIEDEGEGFDVAAIPDPTDPENLFKTSGRGVMFIYNIMDEVTYNTRGNRLTMIKRNEDEEELESA